VDAVRRLPPGLVKRRPVDPQNSRARAVRGGVGSTTTQPAAADTSKVGPVRDAKIRRRADCGAGAGRASSRIVRVENRWPDSSAKRLDCPGPWNVLAFRGVGSIAESQSCAKGFAERMACRGPARGRGPFTHAQVTGRHDPFGGGLPCTAYAVQVVASRPRMPPFPRPPHRHAPDPRHKVRQLGEAVARGNPCAVPVPDPGTRA